MATVDANRAINARMGTVSTLPLDRRKAIDKMLKPHKPRRQEAVVCSNPTCGIVRMVNAGNRKPALCAACSRKFGTFNGGSRQ